MLTKIVNKLFDMKNFVRRKSPKIVFNFIIRAKNQILPEYMVNYFKLFMTDPLPLNVWSSILIQQQYIEGNCRYTVMVKDVVLDSVTNSDPREFFLVKIYLGDQWYQQANVKVRNLVIETLPGTVLTPGLLQKMSKKCPGVTVPE